MGGGDLDNHFLLTIDMQLNHMYIQIFLKLSYISSLEKPKKKGVSLETLIESNPAPSPPYHFPTTYPKQMTKDALGTGKSCTCFQFWFKLFFMNVIAR